MKQKTFLKKVLSVVLALAMIVPSVYLGETLSEGKMEEVQAATADGAYVTEAYDDLVALGYDAYNNVPEKDGYLFAGWYSSEECTKANRIRSKEKVGSGAFAKFVLKDALSVKVQSTTGAVTSTNIDKYKEKYIIRFVSSVDSLNYKQVGFKLTYPDGTTKSVTTSKVFSRIASTTGSVDAEKDTYQYSPQVFCVDSRYFITAKLTLTDTELDNNYTVRAFWVTADGVRVYGDSRVVSYNDKADNIINMHVDTDLDTTKTYTAKSGDTELGSVEVLDKNNVRITLTTGTKASVPSLSDITFTPGDGSEAVVQKAYRNIGSAYTGTPDKTWYTYDTTKKEYVVITSADLYGVAALISASSNFASDVKIYLASDITVNTGDASTWGTTGPTYTWTPIGNSSQSFAATFDGNGHTISGIYLDTQSAANGLFGQVTGTVKNLKLTNSYFKSTKNGMGSVVGYANGATLHTVYSDAIVVGATWGTGGLLGKTAGTVNMDVCWFDGIANSSADTLGGLVGSVTSGTLNLTKCLNSGEVTCTKDTTTPKTAGLVGDAGKNQVNIISCLNTGTIDATQDDSSAAIVGYINTGGEVNCNYSYGYFADRTVGYIKSGSFYVTYLYKGEVYEKADNSAAGKYENVNIISQWKHNNNQFIGKNAETSLEGLDFDNDWSIVKDSTPILAIFADGQSGENGWYDVSWYIDNTDASVFYLYDKEDLYGFAKIVSGEAIDANGVAIAADGFAKKTVCLENDIVINTGDASTWATNAPLYSWTPIATFSGTFNGNGHTISGVYLYTETAASGLFGQVTGTVKNLKLTNSYFKGTKNGMGSVVGYANGATLHTVYSDVIVDGSAWGTGGLVGKTAGSVNMDVCWFGGTVTSSANTLGGLVGSVTGGTLNLTNCLNSGDVNCTNTGTYAKTAGFVGDVGANTVNITRCLNTGTITADTTGAAAAIVGYINTNGVVNCDYSYGYLADNTVGYIKSGSFYVTYLYKGEVFEKADNSAAGKYENVNIISQWQNNDNQFIGSNAETSLEGLDFDNDWVTVKDRTPVLKAFESEGVDLTVDTSWYDANPDATEFVLMDAADLNGFSYISMTDNFQGKTVKLGANITVNTGNAAEWATKAPKYEWYPIGKPSDGSFKPFRGTFDGQNHYISGLYMKCSDEWNGLFAYASETTIKNFTLKNSYFYSSERGLGGICGQLYSGTISDVGIDKDVYIVSNLAGALSDVGGFAGRTCAGDYTAYITNCWFGGTVKNLSTTSRNTGGFVGMAAEGTLIMTDCFMTGHVDAKAYQGGARAGGFVGWNYYNETEMLRCVYNGTYELMSGVKFCAFISLDSQTVTNTGTEEAPVYSDNSNVTFTDCYYAGTSKYYSVADSKVDINGNLPYTHKGNECGDMGWVDKVWVNADAATLGSGWTVVVNYYPYLNAFPQSAETKAVSVESTKIKTWNSELFSQGGWTDGKYFYQAWINKNAEDETLNTVKIVKYDVASDVPIQESKELSLCHANDIAFDATNNRFVVANASVQNFRVSFIDTENLTVTGAHDLDTVTLGITGIYSIDYNVDKECYVIGVSGGQRFMILDANFNQLKQVDPYRPTYMLREYTTQGITCDRDYIYHALSDPTEKANKIAQYDWNGNFIRVIELGIEGEIENISVVGNQIYFAAANLVEEGESTSTAITLYKFDLPAL